LTWLPGDAAHCDVWFPPRKTPLTTGLGIVAANHGHRVLFATATEWVTRLTDADRAGRLPQELAKLRRYGLIIVDEVGYLPFEQDAANLFFQLVSSGYEQAWLILTSNLPFSGWGGVFGDQAVATAMINRVVHHADVLTLKGASYRYATAGSTRFRASAAASATRGQPYGSTTEVAWSQPPRNWRSCASQGGRDQLNRLPLSPGCIVTIRARSQPLLEMQSRTRQPSRAGSALTSRYSSSHPHRAGAWGAAARTGSRLP
jgi:hypothetical protein